MSCTDVGLLLRFVPRLLDACCARLCPYTPLAHVASVDRASTPGTVDLRATPSLLSLGPVAGLVVALALGQLGWRLTRPSN